VLKLSFALGLSLLVVLLAAACTPETTVVLPSNEQTGITVTGQGEVSVSPDVARFTIGVEVERATVAEARDAAAQAAGAIVEALKEHGIAEEDIQTQQLTIYPVYEYSRDERPRIVGYTVSNLVSVTVRDLDRVSEALDAAIEAGGDATRLHGISFEVENREEAIERAREAAMEDARRKAEQLAALAGARLGPPTFISESASTPPTVIPFDVAERGAAAVETPIEPGTTSVTAVVTVRWALESE